MVGPCDRRIEHEPGRALGDHDDEGDDVVGRAQERFVGTGEAAGCRPLPRRARHPGRVEVDEPEVVGREHDVGGLDVAVDDAGGMQTGEGRGDAGAGATGEGLGQRTGGGQQVGERPGTAHGRDTPARLAGRFVERHDAVTGDETEQGPFPPGRPQGRVDLAMGFGHPDEDDTERSEKQ